MNEPSKQFVSVADKLGPAGASLLGVFCPACIPAIGAFLSSIGLGFLINAQVLSGLMIIFIIIAFAGFAFSYFKEHQNPMPIGLAIAGAFGIYGGRYLFPSISIIYIGAVLFITASIYNWHLRKKMLQLESCCAVKSSANDKIDKGEKPCL